jgi:phosphoribosylformylglycinamidine synthase
MKDVCKKLKFPVVSGNVSFYNETSGKGIMPTPVIGAVGLIENYEDGNYNISGQ